MPTAITFPQLAAALADPSVPRLVFQPIVDVARGVVAGYEALARFDAEPFLPPDAWFSAAARFGCAAQLEARALSAALGARASLPENCFLSVNLSPHLLGSPEINRALEDRDLRGIVIELTEHVPYDGDPTLLAAIAALRRAGAMIALDDAGSGYSGLQQLLAIRPEIVKLDRALVAGADTDEAKLALVRMLGDFVGQLDGWLLAEGVETEGELAAFQQLGVPLAQGWLLGRPGLPWSRVAPEGTAAIDSARLRSSRTGWVASLVDDAPSLDLPGRLELGTDDDVQLPVTVTDPVIVAVDEWRRPWALLLAVSRGGAPASATVRPAHRIVQDVLRVAASDGIAETAMRAMTRSAERRFDPVVVTDDRGRLVGLVRVERLISSLATSSVADATAGFAPRPPSSVVPDQRSRS